MVKAGEVFVEGCDAVLKEHRNVGIGVIGTGARGIYSVLRRLAVVLPGRGSHKRVKLLDVSTKLLFGPEKHAGYARRPSSIGHVRLLDDVPKPGDAERAFKLLSYMEKTGLLDHQKILLIDTGFNGTVVKNLKDIVIRVFPDKTVKLMLLYPNPKSDAEIEALPMHLDWNDTRRLARLLEAKPMDRPSSIRRPSSTKPAGVSVGFEFEKWRNAWRPKYVQTSRESAETAKLKHQKLAEYVERYVKRSRST